MRKLQKVKLKVLKLATTLDLRGHEELVIQGVMPVVLVAQPKGLVNLDLMDHLVAPLIQAVMLDPGQTREIKVLSLVMTLTQLVLQSPGVAGVSLQGSQYCLSQYCLKMGLNKWIWSLVM